MQFQPNHKAVRQGGFSLVELLVTVAVLGILSGVMISSFSNVKENSSDIIATEVMETSNLGVKKFNQIAYKLTTAADPDSSADELAVMALLQTRDVTIPGSPFVRPNWNPVGSSSSEDYRIQWTGRLFELLKPGVAGHGLKVNFQATDYN